MDCCRRVFTALAAWTLLSVTCLAQTPPPIPPSVWADRPDGPAFERTESARLAAAQAAIGALVGVKGIRTIENTLEPFDVATMQLENAYWFATLVEEAHPDAAFRDKATAFVEKSAAARDALMLNRAVYDALAGLDLSGADSPTRSYVRRKLQLFRLAGVDRSEAERQRLRKLRAQLATVSSAFTRNIADDQPAVLARPDELEGVPEDFRDGHKPGPDGQVRLTTDWPEVLTVLKFASSDALRARLFEASQNRGYPKNRDALLQMLRLRFEIASLLGYPSWADYDAAGKMVLNARTVSEFIQGLDKLGRPDAQRDLDLLLREKRKTLPDAKVVWQHEGAFFGERLNRATLDYDSSVLRPYLPLETVKRGLLDAASRMFQVSFRQEVGAAAWAPDVETWDVFSNGSMIGRFFLDLHPRPGKDDGSQTVTMLVGKRGVQLPECALLVTYPTPTATDPGLMELDRVSDFFHEFGHVMHRILSGSTQRWAGAVNSTLERDFIETPSQLFGEFPGLAPVLTSFARHYRTGEPIPAGLVEKMRRASASGRGLTMAYFNSLGAISFELHDRNPAGLDLDALCAEQIRRYDLLIQTPNTHPYASFDTLPIYSSAYYTYAWDFVIVEDFLTRFDQNDPFAGETPSRYRRTVLEPGGTMPASDLVKSFLGRPQNTEAYGKWLGEEFRAGPAN